MSSTPDNDTVERRLTQVVDQLQIPNSTLQITQVRLNRLGTAPDIDDDRMDEVAAAALALSSREDGLPVTEGDIANAWSSVLESANVDADVSRDQLSKQLEAVAEYLDVGGGVPPSHPSDLIRQYGERLDMSDRLIEISQRLLHDAFETDATVVAGGTTPAGTAGATLYLGAEINGLDDEYGQDDLGEVSETSEVTVRNRYRELRELLGEENLDAARYQLDADIDEADTTKTATTAPGETPADTTAATDGNGDATAAADVEDAEPEPEPVDAVSEVEEPAAEATETTSETPPADSPEDVVSAVEDEVDALTEELDLSPSTRLFARGMIGDAVDGIEGVTVADSSKLAAAALVAGARMEQKELELSDVAATRSFEARDISQWLDLLDDAVDVDIPRLSEGQIVEKLVEELDLSEEVLEESLKALEQYQAEEIDAEYTAAELGCGAVFFAATVGRTQVDIEDLAKITGATPEYITNAMNSVVVSLCLSLVRGDIDYAECSWTADLLESELSPDIGDSYTGRVIAVAKTYTAGREQTHIDNATLDVMLGTDE